MPVREKEPSALVRAPPTWLESAGKSRSTSQTSATAGERESGIMGDIMMKNALFAAILMLGVVLVTASPAPAQSSGPVYELRIYTTFEGKLPALLARFRDHTLKILERHGMENVGYWAVSYTHLTLP